MSKNQSSNWKQKDKQFIEILQEYELKNALRTKAGKRNAWREISERVAMPEAYCRRKWQGMKYNYLIIKKMIHIGRVTEDIVRRHIKTKKYLDGCLDFLDRNIFEIPDSEIPLAAHRFFESAFGSSEKFGVDAEKLIKIQDNSAIVIQDYKQKTGTEPTSILPNIENYDSDSDIRNTQEAVASLGNDQAASEVYQINNDSTDVEFVDLDVLPNIQMKKNHDLYKVQNYEMKKADPIDEQHTYIRKDPHTHIYMETNFTRSDRLRKILMSTKNETTISSETDSEDGYLYQFLVKYQNTTTEKEENYNLKEYMKDLAEVACNRLTPGTGKRKYFLSQVDLIVSEILEGK